VHSRGFAAFWGWFVKCFLHKKTDMFNGHICSNIVIFSYLNDIARPLAVPAASSPAYLNWLFVNSWGGIC
ncbi:hypothetical protein NE599_20595, partial [[Clostridium] symbiosum]|uniref:hypothetical protein n=1 Tax=Clostridium symbiosum TaxID=1512 RepID=UPI00210C5280